MATNSSLPLGPDIWSYLRGSCVAFTPEQLTDCYPDRATYLAQFEDAARKLERSGALLARDADALITEARQSDVLFPTDAAVITSVATMRSAARSGAGAGR